MWRQATGDLRPRKKSKYDAVAAVIWRDHLYTIGDAAVRTTIEREPVGDFRNCPEWTLEPMYIFWDLWTP